MKNSLFQREHPQQNGIFTHGHKKQRKKEKFKLRMPKMERKT
jgi:hypothetical protein